MEQVWLIFVSLAPSKCPTHYRSWINVTEEMNEWAMWLTSLQRQVGYPLLSRALLSWRELDCQVSGQPIKTTSQSEIRVQPWITCCPSVSKGLDCRTHWYLLFHLSHRTVPRQGQLDQHTWVNHLTTEGALSKRLLQFYGCRAGTSVREPTQGGLGVEKYWILRECKAKVSSRFLPLSSIGRSWQSLLRKAH